ncbi:bifunctional heptose 7-phosphate kinase/heptose 1-phosphate adenyltransferase [Leptolyngbya sp. AN03gr2]|uniref:bifunctional heptose 7-phosphate kinase/heptose 1-phosphate adenyltransferase n=1 Tax=unclassified Leptolyngbya TaxID=2650499 RepID=UPI003D3127C7
MSDFFSVLEQFSRSRILVIGEAMLDRYLHGGATRLCQETPAPVVTVSRTIDQPGGAANTAMNLQSLGAEVTLLSVVGEDSEGIRLRQVMPGIQGIVTASDRTTLTKQRIMDGDRLLLRFDQGTIEALSIELENKLITKLRTQWNDYDAIIISDYGYGILTDLMINTVHQLQRHQPKVLVVDAKNLAKYQYLNVTAVKPNYQQTLNLLDQIEEIHVSRIQYVKRNAEQILERTGAKIVAATLDREGVILLQRDRAPYQIRVNPACPTQTIGAGDTFTAAFSIALTMTDNPTIAAEIAAAAAAIVVQKPGTARCTLKELQSTFNHVLEPS